MNEIAYRTIDAGHGAIFLLLATQIGRLLIVRKGKPHIIRYTAAALLIIVTIQIAMGFWFEEEQLNIIMSQTLLLWVDLLAAIFGITAIAVLIYNRNLYLRTTIYSACCLIVAQWSCFLFCVLWQFADWTYLVYLPTSALLWGAFGRLIDHATPLPTTAIQKNQNDCFIEQLNTILRNNQYFCQEGITRDEICRKMLTNRTTFSQRLHETTGLSFTEYLREMRLQEAVRLLTQTDMPINQIAYEVGLRSASGFHRNFLLSYGQTPRQYRERHRQLTSMHN